MSLRRRAPAALLSLAACGGPAPVAGPPVDLPPCNPTPADGLPAPWDRDLRVAVFVGGDLPDAAGTVAVARASEIWGPAGVRLHPLPTARLPAAAGLAPSADGRPPETPAALVEGLRPAARANADVAFVVVPHVVAPSLPWPGDRLLGLTLAPGAGPGAALYDALGEPGAPPVVVLGWRDLHADGGTAAALTPGHELGHALGLAHDPDPNALMAPRPGLCRPAPPPDPLRRPP